MIKAIITDFSRVLLFPIDDSYAGGLNKLNNKLLAENPHYNFWEYFKINQELLDYYRELNDEIPVFVFTSESIQEHPAVRQEIDSVFSGILSALDFGLQKSDSNVYRAVANRLQLPSSEILFIDDNAINATQAMAAGMQALRYESNQQTIDQVNAVLQK